MNPGLFKHRITIQQYSETENSIGDIVRDWTNLKEVWAMVKTVKGSEFIQAQAVQGERIVRFVIRYTKGITNDMRIIYDSRIFEIESPPINDDELNKTLTIMAREVV